MPPTFLRTDAPASKPPVKEPSQPKRRLSTRRVIVGSLLLVLVGGIWLLVANAFQFHQEVTTGPHITSMHTGTGINPTTGEIEGEAITFHVGDTVYVNLSCPGPVPGYPGTFCSPGRGNSVTANLFQGNNLIPSDIFFGGYGLGFYATLPHTGVYKWVLYYNGIPEASITFQVV